MCYGRSENQLSGDCLRAVRADRGLTHLVHGWGHGSAGSDKGEEILAEAIIKIKVGSQVVHIAAEGNGPVNAIDGALRKALLQFYPELAGVKLLDYKVRIPEESSGSGSLVHVFIRSGDGEHEWHTLGSSVNVIEASWLALADSLEYWLLKKGTERR